MNLIRYLTESRKGHISKRNFKPESKLHYLSYIPLDVNTILDVGCGYGELLFLLKQKGYKVSGCDIYDELIKKAKQISEDVILADAEQLTNFYPFNNFDLVSLIHVLEHLPNPLKALLEAKAVSKKYVLLAVPNARYVLHDERETHLYSWNSVTLTNLIKKAGLTILTLSENPVNLFPNIIRVSPIISRILIKFLWEPMEIICLTGK